MGTLVASALGMGTSLESNNLRYAFGMADIRSRENHTYNHP
jgi:hypothetical protein